MAKTPTLGTWELDLLRTIEHVVRLGHIKHVTAREIVLDDGSVPLPPGSLVVHCAASGLRYPPLVPLWEPDKIRLQTIRAGFPCFCAALAGYVEATRDDDRERNRLCPPNTLPDSPANWARMQVRGTVAARTYGAEPDIAAWADGCALNPARIPSHLRSTPAVQEAASRLAAVADQGTRAIGHTDRAAVGEGVKQRTMSTAVSGAPGRIRTCGTRFRKPLLYPLSYGGGASRSLAGRTPDPWNMAASGAPLGATRALGEDLHRRGRRSVRPP